MMKNEKNNEDCNGQSWKYSKEITCSLKQCSYEEKTLNKHDQEDCWKSIKSIINNNKCSCSEFDDEMIGINADMLKKKVCSQNQDVSSVDLIIGLKGRDNNDKRLLCVECKCNVKKSGAKYLIYRRSALKEKYCKSKELLHNISTIPVCEVLIVLFSSQYTSQNTSQNKFNRFIIRRESNNHNFSVLVPSNYTKNILSKK